MSLYETIQSDMYEAMKSKDKLKASTLRIALAKLKDKKIEKREDLNENDEISIISETGAKNMNDMGKVMPEIMKRSAGQADGKMAQQIVSKLLQ